MLWFHRILGLTFGGLVIDSNGKLSQNKYYKFYGYFITIVYLVFDLFHFGYFLSEVDSIKHHYDLDHQPKVFLFLLISIGIVFNAYKYVSLYHFNVNGYEFAMIIQKIIKNNLKTFINFKCILIMFGWVTTVIMVIVLAVQSINSSLQEINSIVDCSLMMIFFVTLNSVTWIVSVSFCKRLDMFKNNLEKFKEDRLSG